MVKHLDEGEKLMKILIHTYKRPHKQTTLSQIPEEWRKNTYLVVQAREFEKYEKHTKDVNVLVLPDHIRELSPTRQHLLETAVKSGWNKIVLMDDDLTFSYRQPDTGTKLYQDQWAIPEVGHMLTCIEEQLDEFVHVGVSAREGNNRVPSWCADNTRMMRVLAYRPKDVLDLGCRFDRVRTKQDFDMTLQLLRKGRPNRVIYDYAHNQPGSNTEGGCSEYRTEDVMTESAHKLAELHPGFVKVVEKKTKTSWGGGTRTDVTIYWKKAFQSCTS